MARHQEYRPKTPIHDGATPTQVPEQGHVARGGLVHRVYEALADDERHAVVEAIGLKHAQRIGHRHKVAALRDLKDLASQWGIVDGWVRGDDSSSRAIGDLFDPFLASLVTRARELLGEHADEPNAEQMTAMAQALADERSVAVARLLLATVVELEFTAAPEARAVGESDDRFTLPD
jgi:hypothetical protein